MICKFCSNIFETTLNKPGPKRKMFCSHECTWKYRNNKRSNGRTKKCKACSELYEDSTRVNNSIFCQECSKHKSEFYKYGLSGKETQKLKEIKQCQICASNDTLSIDHDHSTGKIRGVLCRRCNTSLGSFQDSEELLQNAINYLRRSK